MCGFDNNGARKPEDVVLFIGTFVEYVANDIKGFYTEKRTCSIDLRVTKTRTEHGTSFKSAFDSFNSNMKLFLRI